MLWRWLWLRVWVWVLRHTSSRLLRGQHLLRAACIWLWATGLLHGSGLLRCARVLCATLLLCSAVLLCAVLLCPLLLWVAPLLRRSLEPPPFTAAWPRLCLRPGLPWSPRLRSKARRRSTWCRRRPCDRREPSRSNGAQHRGWLSCCHYS